MEMYMEQQFYVHTNHCDFKDDIRTSAVFDFFQDLAGAHADKIGVGFEAMQALNYAWVVMYEQMEVVKRLPTVREEIVVKTWPKPRRRLEFEREYEVCDSNGDTLIRGISNWTVMDSIRRTITKAENVVFQGEYFPKTNYAMPQKRKLNFEVDDSFELASYKVLLSDLDHNYHLNNSKYLDILYNLQTIKNYKKWNKVEIAFLHEARLEDMICIKYKNEQDKSLYKGYIGDIPCFEAIIYWDK